MRTHRTVAIALAAFAAACSDSPNGPDLDAECNRGAFELGATTSGTIANSACHIVEGGVSIPYHEYDVDLNQGSRYMFTLTTGAAWNPDLELLDPGTGERLATGWADDAAAPGGYSEILYVAQRSGRFKLRVRSTAATAGAYMLRSQGCNGLSREIFSADTVTLTSTLGESECVLHDRWLPGDSARAHTFVLYLNRQEKKTITLTGRGASAGVFHPAIVVTGPFQRDASGWTRANASGTTTASLVLTGPSDNGGTYIVAVTGASYDQLGDYTLTIAPGGQ